MALLVIFMMFMVAVVSAFIQSIYVQKNIIKEEREDYINYYGRECLSKMAALHMLNMICNQTIEVPISVLNESIYAYDSAFGLIKKNSEVQSEVFIGSIGHPIVVDTLKSTVPKCLIRLSISDFYANYENPNNILNFSNGDILYLQDITVKVSLVTGRKDYDTTYTVKGLFADIIHSETAFQIRFNQREVSIY